MTGKIKFRPLPAFLILLSITINMLFLPSYIHAPDTPDSSPTKSFFRMYEAGLLYREEDSRTNRLLVQDKQRLSSNIPGFSFAGIPADTNKATPYLNYCLVSAGALSLGFSSIKIVDSLHLKDGMK